MLEIAVQKAIETIGELAVKGTSGAIQAKIKSWENEKNVDKLNAHYAEVINNLLAEREQLLLSSQVLVDATRRMMIDEKDIPQLQKTAEALLDICYRFLPLGEEYDSAKQLINTLISAETLRTMQLLGFNFKEAIGEPLTKLIADIINRYNQSLNKNQPSRNNGIRRK